MKQKDKQVLYESFINKDKTKFSEAMSDLFLERLERKIYQIYNLIEDDLKENNQ